MKTKSTNAPASDQRDWVMREASGDSQSTNQVNNGDSRGVMSSDDITSPVEKAIVEVVEESLRQLRTFLIIIYGCCVRFYSTVVDWEYIQRMSEDLIERMTSKLFEDDDFSQLIV